MSMSLYRSDTYWLHFTRSNIRADNYRIFAANSWRRIQEILSLNFRVIVWNIKNYFY